MAEAKVTSMMPNQGPAGHRQPGTSPEDEAISISFGPPMAELSPQDPNTGLRLAGAIEQKPKRLILKHAHKHPMDYRIFDPLTGKVVCVSHPFGANPYESYGPNRPPMRQGGAHSVVTGAPRSPCPQPAWNGPGTATHVMLSLA